MRRKSAALGFAFAKCALGKVLVARSDDGIRAIVIGDDREQMIRDLEERAPHASAYEERTDVRPLAEKIARLIDEPWRDCAENLDLVGTLFQQNVWRALQEIPPGSTESYGSIAARIGKPGCARAVGQACAANPYAPIFPCHRAKGANGSLTGYRWGIERKEKLLALERSAPNRP